MDLLEFTSVPEYSVCAGERRILTLAATVYYVVLNGNSWPAKHVFFCMGSQIGNGFYSPNEF
jgi:hypothetical protein